jgi:hypothetical protein
VIRALGLLAVLALGGAVEAASLTLSNPDRRAAILAGERSVITDAFDEEWRVANGGGETAVVLTPFHRLAIAARHAAFRNEPLKPREIERALKEDAGRLVLWVHLRGPREDFARHYVPRLLAGDRQIRASFVQNERTAVRQHDGGFLARCVYGFPVRDLTGDSRLALVVADADGRDVSRFTIDLARMR